MSTILNTLRKLEEEKSVLEKNVDLKNLVLQDGTPASSGSGKTRTQGWSGVAAVVAGAVLLGTGAWWISAREPVPPAGSSLVKNPPAVLPSAPVMEITSPPQESLTGVPLAHIPEPFQRNGDPGPSAMAEPSSPPLPAKPEAAKKPPPPEPAGTAEVREIDRLIRSATQTAFQDTPEDSLLPPVTGEGIPGLKIKGIIFFAPGNASNHIFVATPENPNLKLRVGESVLDATLRSVYSSKAEFEYQGRRVELALGQ